MRDGTTRWWICLCAAWVGAAPMLGCQEKDAAQDGANQETPDADASDDPAQDTSDDAPEDLADQPDDPAPPYTLQAPVEVRYDDLGIPHLYAQNDQDLFFAAGYQEASDVLFALDMFRRSAVGRRAEVLGEGALGGDIQARALGFVKWARPSVELMAQERPEDLALLRAFVGGLNRRVEEVRAGRAPKPEPYARLGFEPEPFTEEDLMSIGLRIQFGYSSTLEFDLLNTLVRKLSPDANALSVFRPAVNAFIMDQDTGRRQQGLQIRPTTQPAPRGEPPQVSPEDLQKTLRAIIKFRRDLGVGDGSNAWSLHGDVTFNGRPMLANDSHGGFTDPNQLYLYHLNSADAGGNFDVMGFGFLGIPGVQIGHNRAVAWGATTNFSDLTDLWDVQVRDGMAKLGDQMNPVVERTEQIRVKQPDGSFVERALTVREVEGYGVILPEEILPAPKGLIAQGELLLNWPGFTASDELFVFLDMDRAQDLDDFEAAVGLQKTGMQNWSAVSAEGMRYKAHGKVPDRGPVEGRPKANEILDGDDGSTFWTGAFLPEAQLPRLAGDQPFIASANNDPWGHTQDNDPLNDEFYYGSFFAPGFRAGRLAELLTPLAARGGITVEETQQMQLEVYSPLAARLIPMLEQAAQGLDTNPALEPWRERADLRDAVTRLAAWDRRMTLETEDGLLYRFWYAYLSRALLGDDLSLLFDVIDEEATITVAKFMLLALEDDVAAITEGKRDELLVGALADALDELAQREAKTWGEVHRAVFGAFDDTSREFATPGDDASLNVAESVCWKDGELAPTCRTGGGAVYRTVTTFDEDGTPRVVFNWPLGNAGLMEDWLTGTYKPWPFRRPDVETRTARTQLLEP